MVDAIFDDRSGIPELAGVIREAMGVMISEPGRLWGEGKSQKNASKMLPEPFRQAPPKMLQKWSPNGLWTHF